MIQYRILLKVREASAPLRIGGIAKALGVTASAATQAVDVLESRALVRRRGSTEDGRGTVVAITAEGIEKVRPVDSALASHVAALWGSTPAEGTGPPYRTAIGAIGTGIEGGADPATVSTLVPSGYITSIEEGLRGASATLRAAEAATFGECRVLQCLRDGGGRRRISEIASLLVLASSTTSHIVDRLMDRGWAVRLDAEGDRRGIDLEITGDGTAALDRMRSALDAYGREHLWRQLSPEQAALTYDAARRLADLLSSRSRTG